MSPRSRRPKRRATKRPRRAQGGPGPRPEDDEPDLLAHVGDALRAEHPIELLAQVSGLLNAVDPRSGNPLEHDPAPVPTLEELLPTFFGVSAVETSALLAGIAGMSPDEMLRRRVRREVGERGHALPGWLQELAATTATPRVVEVVHVLGDGDNVLVGARLPDGRHLTAVVYIDHNAGTVVKDAFVVPAPVDELVEQLLEVADDPDTQARDIAAADARARIAEAVEHGARVVPPFESDTWPSCRPLVEWMAALLPPGGIGYQRPEWGDAALAELTERFFASTHGAAVDDEEHRNLWDSLLWFGTDYGPGDPLRWSPTAVEILLLDWIPRKIVADAEHLAKAPDLLRALVRFSHAERDVRPELTAQTLSTVDEFEPEYQRMIRSERPQGPLALLAALGLPVADGHWADGDLAEPYDVVLDELARAVGGPAALDALDTAALPADEAFDWAPVPPDVHDRVAAVLALVDGCCDALLDAECRTACRRLLARAAAADPAIFRRRSRADTTALTVVWMIVKANGLLGPRRTPHCTVKSLLAHFGLAQGNFTQRSAPFLRAIGAPPPELGELDLGSPDYLVSGYRQRLVADRDRLRSLSG